YDFKAHLEEGIFQTSFLKEPFRETTGELLFTKDALSFRDVKATFGKDPVVLSGKLIHFQDPELDLTLSSTVEAQTFVESLPQKNLLSPVSLKGPVALETHLAGKMNALTIAGSLQAKDVLVKGIPYFGTLEHVHGPIEFTGNSLKTPGLSGFYQQFPFELSGTLTDFQNPILDLRLRFTKNLKELEKSPLLNVLPDNKRPSFSGTGQWDVAVKGSLKDPSARSLLGTCSLQNASLRTAFLPSTVESIDGKFSFDNKAVGWKGVTGNYAGNSFMLDGSFQPGDTPQIGIDLTTKAFELSSRFTLQGKDLRPFTLSQRTSRSAFTLQGEILNYDAPILKVSGEWKGTVEELQKLPFLKTKAFPGTNLEGRLITQFSLSGPKDRVPDITVEGRLSSDLLTWKKWRFKNLSTRYTYAQNTLGLSQFSSEVSQGRLLGKATVLFSDKRPYKVAMEARGVQLSEVIQMWTPDQKQFRGHLSGMFQGEGNFSQPKEVTGEGWVKIEEGDLFQIPILGGLKPVLRPIIGTLYPQLDTMITFQEAQAHYTLQNQSVSTDDLTLKGDRANLYGEGHVGFDQSLDFRVGVQFTDPEILQRPTDLSRLKNILISDTGMLAGEVRVTGTLAEPHYKYSPLPLQRIKSLFRETRDILFERLLE
ncbi:MAG: hypothetical protein HY590_04055, partial [Candidatus Omnitrophica bacterium]|nr:hypothetical protein [Candidatus Omnitrophota bacterium]